MFKTEQDVLIDVGTEYEVEGWIFSSGPNVSLVMIPDEHSNSHGDNPVMIVNSRITVKR